MLHLRPATPSDALAMAHLSDELGYPTPLEKMETRLKALLNVPLEHQVWVAIVDDQVAGWLHACYTLRVESDPFVEIGGLVVGDQYRRQGIGKQLVEQAGAWARTRGGGKLRVRCQMKRKDSHLFYLQLGFVEHKEQKVFDMPV